MARILDELLHRAGQGPEPTERVVARALARERSAASLPLRRAPEASVEEGSDEGARIVPIRTEDEGGVVPFGIFDPDAQGDYG